MDVLIIKKKTNINVSWESGDFQNEKKYSPEISIIRKIQNIKLKYFFSNILTIEIPYLFTENISSFSTQKKNKILKRLLKQDN